MKTDATHQPVALTIAGSDCSAGAGLQADLKTFSHFKVYGLTAVTCVVAEVPGKVTQIQAVDLPVLEDQIRLLLGAFPVAAVKTGMLYSREAVRMVAEAFAAMPLTSRPALVVDPVMVATSGDSLIHEAAVEAYQDELFPLAQLITPNMNEAAVLLGRKLKNMDDLHAAAEALHERYGCAVLLKGGHLKGDTAPDVLRDQAGFQEYHAARVMGVSTHGTGCTSSAAITAQLALGRSLRQSVAAGKRYITRAIGQSFTWSRGRSRVDALNHFAQKR